MPTFGSWQRHLYLLGGTFYGENETNFQTGKFEAFNLDTGLWMEVTYFFKNTRFKRSLALLFCCCGAAHCGSNT